MANRGFSDLLSSASSLFNAQSHSSSPSPSPSPSHDQTPSSLAEEGNAKPSHAKKPSYGEIYASAQVVMNAAKAKLQKPGSSSSSSSEDVSMGKLAGAAETLIGAVSHYSKLEETNYGKYAHKAQEYLQTYEIKHGKPGITSQSSAHHSSSEQDGYGTSTYTSSEVRYSQPSAPPQGYPAEYPPQGYPDAQQGYGDGPQGRNKKAESPVNVENYPPVGYPPAGYPTSGGRPTKYS